MKIGRPTAAGLVAAALAMLIVHNLALTLRNQIAFDSRKIQRQPTALLAVLIKNRDVKTRNTFAFYYTLRRYLDGASLEMTLPFDSRGWWFRQVAHVATKKGELHVAGDAAFDVAASGATVSVVFSVREDQRIHFVVGDKAERYVFVRRESSADEWLVIPKARLASLSSPVPSTAPR